jgi:hypothetical protein
VKEFFPNRWSRHSLSDYNHPNEVNPAIQKNLISTFFKAAEQSGNLPRVYELLGIDLFP